MQDGTTAKIQSSQQCRVSRHARWRQGRRGSQRFNMARNEKLNRYNFLKKLAHSLIEPQLRRRLECCTLRVSIKRLICKILNEDPPPVSGHEIIRDESRARCALCDKENAKHTRMRCHTCRRRICDDHRSGACFECAANAS
ncbi:unnamed protein product [Euphydryas editha]|uniref:PiggyBac transposable element-derived protein 4 C-terminal zinc-ribbon domain-containing protein n=1 Tax=Euphydryas editha TaxID=104508 RepID=A0AAU9VF79_EUPED|nr:unnamed protein product [Euphydryas editha]